MDLLYINPTPEQIEELLALELTIEDASDDIHTERKAIHFNKEQDTEDIQEQMKKYKEFLIKHNLQKYSLGYLTNEL